MAAVLAAVIALSLSASVEGFARAFVTNLPAPPEPVGEDPSKGALADTFQALDTDGSGFVEGDEIKAFAEAQGIAGERALADLSDIDADGDGRLSFAELVGTLGAPAPAPAANVAADDGSSDVAPPSAYEEAMSTAVSSAVESAGLSADLATSALTTDTDSSSASSTSVDVSAVSDAPEASPLTMSEWFRNASRTAEQLALHDAATLFVEGVAQALEQREKDTASALQLEAKARELRANATKVVKEGPALVEAAARQAVERAMLKPMGDVQKLESLAALAERKATRTRERAHQLRARALAEQGEVLSSVRQLRSEVGIEIESS